IDRMPAPVFTYGRGLDLENFLASQGIDINSISHIRFHATDSIVKKLDRNILLDRTGYYYPKIVECWDSDGVDGEAYVYPDVQRASEGATPVKPMLAITSSQGRFLPVPDRNNLDGSTCLRLCLGQASPEECITMNFVRWVYKIEVFGKLQSGGGGSIAPRVSLTAPAANASYQAGDKVEIRGTVERISSLSLTITDPDGHSIYTVFDLEAKDGSFTEEYTLEADAVSGKYTIEAGPVPGSSLGSQQTFQVTAAPASAASITLNTPPAGHIYKPQDKVAISGTIRGSNTAKLEIFGPHEKSVYTGTINKSGEFSEEFTPGSDALPGDYTIKISAPGMKQIYTRVFKVAAKGDGPADTPGKNITETKPQAVAQPVPSTPGSSLNDISNHWAAERIKDLLARGAIKGYPDGTFQPDATITRAEFITVVVKAFNLINPNGRVFTDTSGHWAQDYIATATAAGIVGGYNDSNFGPNDPVTREQMAVIVVKAAQLTPIAAENQFADSSNIAPWAREAVATAVNKQIIKGYPDNSFKPGSKANRAEAAAVIVNALNLK
ncbi:MAG: S-layer homology domain-containing protein, partial [Syntrophomonas sp.]|nr:S-layer homology domain-containing protein [Syntrophomonas sp.]